MPEFTRVDGSKGYAMNPQLARAQDAGPVAQADGDSGDERVDGQTAGYMELDGAQKDSDCETVNVSGGVSSQLGCCNLFDPNQGAQQFNCGTCEHVEASNAGSQQGPTKGNGNSGTPPGGAVQPQQGPA